MSDGRSTFIEWVQYLAVRGLAAEAGAVVRSGPVPGRVVPDTRSSGKRIQNMLDGYDDALNDCLRDPDLCLAEQFSYDPDVLHGDAERRDHALAHISAPSRAWRPWSRTATDLSTRRPSGGRDDRGAHLFKSFFEEGSDGGPASISSLRRTRKTRSRSVQLDPTFTPTHQRSGSHNAPRGAGSRRWRTRRWCPRSRPPAARGELHPAP